MNNRDKMDHALKSLLDNIPLEEINLSVRPHNALRRAGLVSVLDVYKVIDDESIWTIPNLGTKSVEEIFKNTDQFLSAYSPFFSNIHKNETDTLDAEKLNSVNVESLLPDIKVVSNIPIEVLENYLGVHTVKKLLSIDLRYVGDLDQILKRYMDFLLPSNLMLEKIIDIYTLRIRKLISLGNLSPNSIVNSIKLGDLLNSNPVNDEEKSSKIQSLKLIYSEKSLTDLVNQLMDFLTDRQRDFFLDYSFRDLTLEEISKKQPERITRERVRQVIKGATTRLNNAMNSSFKVYFSTALEIANEMGVSLTQDGWKSELINRKIILDTDQDCPSFDIFLALLKNKYTSVHIVNISENVKFLLKTPKEYQSYILNSLSKDKKQALSDIKRIIKFTGGIAKEHAEQILETSSRETQSILKLFGINEVYKDWYTMVNEKELTNLTPIYRAGLIMMQACGSLPFESFYDGLRRYVSRHYEALAPAEVIKKIIENYGFQIENDIVTYEGNKKVILSTSETLLIDLIRKRGPVLNFQDIVEYYLSNGKSFATATTKIMPSSPIIEKIEQGLYKLRGTKLSWHDIEKAKSRQEEYSRNVEVTYGLDGIIRYRVTIGSWEAGGSLSISRLCQPLPDFSQGWPVYANKIKIGIAKRDDYLIWGLAPAFTLLGVKFGDRIELAFDSWNKPRINVRIVEENNG